MSKVEMQNAKIQLTLRTTICTRCLSKLKARCPEKVEAIKLRMDSSSRSILECQHRELVWLWVLAWTSLNREEMICNVWLANAIQIEVVKIYQPSEDWQQQSQAVPHLASWCSSDTLLDSNFYWKFVKLAVGSIPVCVFDKSIGLLVNIPFCSWRKQPNPWRHPGTPLPEILGGLALVRLGFTPKMLGNQSHSPSVNVMAWYGTIRIHTKLTSKFLVSSTILLAYEPRSKFIVCVKSVIKLVSPLSFYRLSCFYILWQLFTSV